MEGSSEPHHLQQQQQLQQAKETVEQIQDQQTLDKFKLYQFDRQLQQALESIAQIQHEQVTGDESKHQFEHRLQQVNENVAKLQEQQRKKKSYWHRWQLPLLLVLVPVLAMLLLATLLPKYHFGDRVEINDASETSSEISERNVTASHPGSGKFY